MRKNLFFAIVIFLILLISCSQNNIKNVEFKIKKDDDKNVLLDVAESDVKHITLKSEKIFGLFTEIAVKDSLLICGNLRSPKLINTYSLNSGKLIDELITRGESEYEGLSVSSLYIQNNYLWIYDITLSKFFKTEINNKKIDSSSIKKIDLAKNLKNIIFPVIINDSLILATTYAMNDFRYLYANPQKTLKNVGQLPKVKNSEYLTDAAETKFPNKAFIFKAIAIKNSSENKTVVFYNKTDRAEFYSNDRLIKVVQNQDGFNPIMQVAKLEEGGYLVEDSDKTKYAYLSTAYTDRYIYSLYSGSNETSSNSILVFDWNGEFIKKLELDRKVCKIFIEPKRNILYSYEIEANGIYSANLNYDL